jgi:inner membrane transporter RhtA
MLPECQASRNHCPRLPRRGRGCGQPAGSRLPLSTVGAIEFGGTVILAAAGTRTPRNAAALALTTAGVAAITAIRLAGQAMLIAAVAATPWGLGGALPAFGHPVLLLAGAGVGVCSSVIPYVTDNERNEPWTT